MGRFLNNLTTIDSGNLCINHESWGEPIVIVEGASIVIGNLFVLLVLSKYSMKRFRPLNCFILQLALADLCVGGVIFWIGFLSSKVYRYVTLLHGIFAYGSLASASSVSTLSVLFIAIDRYIYVLRHRKYKTIMSKRLVITIMSISWLLPITVFVIAPASGWSCVSSCDCRIYNEESNLEYCVGGHCSQMMTPFRKETLLIGGLCLLASLLASALLYILLIVQVRFKAKRPIKHKRRRESEMRLIKTMVIVLGGFLLTTGPLAILCTLSYFHNVRQLHLVMRIMVVISNINSIMNPFFYFLRIPQMSKNFRKLWRSVLGCAREKSRDIGYQSDRRYQMSLVIPFGRRMTNPDCENSEYQFGNPDGQQKTYNRSVKKRSYVEDKESSISVPWSTNDVL